MPQPGSPSSPWNYYQRTRWWNFFNSESRLTVPPFGIMALRPLVAGGKRLTHLCQYQAEGDVVWNIGQTNDDEAFNADASMFAFNGPYAIPPQRTGWGTFDFPAQVLHNGANDTLPNGYACGPVPRTWFVMRNQIGQFRCLSHDITHAAHLGDNRPFVHTVWVTRGSGDGGLHGYWTGGGPSIGNGLDVPMVIGAFGLGGQTGVVTKDGWMTALAAGVWHFGFQCTISGLLGGLSDAPRGSMLRLGIVKRDLQLQVSPLPWTGMRLQDVENGVRPDTQGDPPGGDDEVLWKNVNDQLLITKENLSFTGFVNLRAGEGVKIRNLGAAARVEFAQFWMTRSIQYFDTSPPPESGGAI